MEIRKTVGKYSFIRARDPSIVAWARPAMNPSIRQALCDELSSKSLINTSSSSDDQVKLL